MDATDEDVVAFIDEMRLLLAELQESDQDAQAAVDSIFPPKESDVFEDAADALDGTAVDANASGSLSVRPPNPTGDAMQIDESGDGTVNPQGCLLPDPVLDANASTGDVEAARPGGLPG